MNKKVAVVIKDLSRQYEGLRTSLGLLLENHKVSMIVLNHEIQLSEAYEDNLQFVEEMGGERLSNVPANIDQHRFKPVSLKEVGQLLRDFELIIPF